MNPLGSPVNKQLKISPYNKSRKTPNSRAFKLKRPSIKKINSEKSQCCLEANKKIKQLEIKIEDLKREIKLLKVEPKSNLVNKLSTKNEFIVAENDHTGETEKMKSSQEIRTFVSDIRQELEYDIPTDNRFAALSKPNTKNDTDDQTNVENANSASQMQKTPKGDKQSILIGDSQVRNILKNFCPDSKRKTVHCYPNINTENAATNTSGILGAVDKSDKDAAVIVNIGSYDVLNCQTKHIKENMKILIKELADRRANRNIKIAEITPHLYNKGLNKKINTRRTKWVN